MNVNENEHGNETNVSQDEFVNSQNSELVSGNHGEYVDDASAIAEIEAKLSGVQTEIQETMTEENTEMVPYSDEPKEVVDVPPADEPYSEAVVSDAEKKKLKFNRVGIIVSIAVAFVLIVALVITLCAVSCGGNSGDDQKQNPMTVMFVKNISDNTAGSIEENGDLYIAEQGKPKELVASNVSRYNFETFGDNNLIYCTQNADLYVKQYGKANEKIAGSVHAFKVCETKKDTMILYSSGESLFLRHLEGGTEKIGDRFSGQTCYYDISKDGKKIYYTDMDQMFYIWTAEKGSEKIDSGIGYISVGNDAYFYDIYNNQGQSNGGYIKLANDTGIRRIDENEIYNVKFTKNELVAFMQVECEYGDEFWLGDLCAYVSGGDAIRIAPDVREYTITENMKYLYYWDVDGGLYRKNLPVINKKTVLNPQAFKAQLDGQDKIRVGSDVIAYKVSPNGKNVATLDSQRNLFVSTDGRNAVKVASDVENFEISDYRFWYVDKAEKLYLNSVIDDEENIQVNTKLIAVNTKMFGSSTQGKYIMFHNASQDTIDVCIDGQTPKTIATEAQTYDYVYYDNSEVYENVIEFETFVGKYKNDDLGYLFEIRKEGEGYKLDWWISGYVNTVDAYAYSPIDRYSLDGTAYYNGEYCINRFVKKNGIKWIGHNNMNYALTPLTDAEFQRKIEKQRARDEHRGAVEARRNVLQNKIEAMEDRGRDYMWDDVYVTTTTPLYSYHNKEDLLEGVNYNTNGYQSVRTYYVSADGTTLWLQLYGRYGGDYVWMVAN